MAILEDAEIANALGAGARTAGADDVEYREQIDEKSQNLTASPLVIESWVSLAATGCRRLLHVGRGATNIKSDQASDAAPRLLQGQVAKHGADKNWARVERLARRVMALTPKAGPSLRNCAVAKALTQGRKLRED